MTPSNVTKFSNLPRRTRAIKPTDLVVVVDVTGQPVTEAMSIADFFRNQVELVSPPTSPISAGSSKTIAIDDTYIHTYNNGIWKKVRRDSVTVIQPEPWRLVSSATTAEPYDRITADTSAGGFTIELPENPEHGAYVEFADTAETWGANNLVIGRAEQLIEGEEEDLTCDVGDRFKLIFVGGAIGWRILA